MQMRPQNGGGENISLLGDIVLNGEPGLDTFGRSYPNGGVVITGGFHSSVPGSAAVLAIAVEGLSVTGLHGLGSDTRNATLLQASHKVSPLRFGLRFFDNLAILLRLGRHRLGKLYGDGCHCRCQHGLPTPRWHWRRRGRRAAAARPRRGRDL